MKKGLAFVFLILSGEIYSSFAQVEAQLTPAEMKQRTIVTEPQTIYKGYFRSSFVYSFAVLDKIFTDQGKKESLPGNIWSTSSSATFTLVYGVTNRLQVGLMIPYVNTNVFQSFLTEFPLNDSTFVVEWRNHSSGLGDLRASVDYQFLVETPTRPSFSGYFDLTLPTGEKNPTNIKSFREFSAPQGQGEFKFSSLFILRKIRYPLVYSVNVAYTYSFGGKKLLDVEDTEEKPFRSGANISFGGYLNFHVNDWIAIRNFADYFYSMADTFDGEKEAHDSWVLQYQPGLSFQLKRLRCDQFVSIPVKGKLTLADPSYLITFSYVF